MLHVLNSDATLRVFQRACLPGDVLVCRSILAEGPAAPPAVRAPYLAELLGAAVRCHLARFPSVGRGVNEVEEAILSALADGPLPFSPLWRRVSRDARVRAHGMGDVQFAAHLRELAAGAGALVALEGDARACASWRPALTALGRDVLARRRDWLALHPLRRCLGGVHLHPEDTAWRWDAARGRLGGDAR